MNELYKVEHKFCADCEHGKTRIGMEPCKSCIASKTARKPNWTLKKETAPKPRESPKPPSTLQILSRQSVHIRYYRLQKISKDVMEKTHPSSLTLALLDAYHSLMQRLKESMEMDYLMNKESLQTTGKFYYTKKGGILKKSK